MTSAVRAQVGVPWPEADRLFHSDQRWLGADAAFSVDLGKGRVLWMFNDTFVARRVGDSRKDAAFVRNTVAVQSGYDPSHAGIRFYWKSAHGEPSPIFPSEGAVWMWPGSGIRIGDRLLLFCERVAQNHAKDSLGFRSVGWNAYWVSNPEDEPSAWKMKIALRMNDTVILASQVLRRDGYVYLFGQSEPEHDLYMARWKEKAFAKGRLGPLQWWGGGGWQTERSKRRPVVLNAGTETSVQRNPVGDGFLEVNSDGFGAADIVMRGAPALEGPWSAPRKVYRPQESDAADPFVYAGKSHAELQGADLIVTYVANGPAEKVAGDLNLYFPRFVRVDLRNGNSAY